MSFLWFLKIMSLPHSENPSFLLVFGDYEFTKEFTKILWRPLVNSVGASPVGLQRFPKTEEFTKPAIMMSFPLVFEDYEFTKK